MSLLTWYLFCILEGAAVGSLLAFLEVSKKLWWALIIINSVFIGLMTPSFSHAAENPAMEQLRKTAVRIDGNGCMGSGSVVEGKSGKHYILTNQHLCNCAKYRGNIYATFEDGQQLVGTVVSQNWNSDLCAAHINGYDKALKLGRSLAPLTEVNTRGWPGGRLTESHGHVVGTVRWSTDFPIEQIGVCPTKSKPVYGSNDVLAACTLTYVSVLSNLYARPGSSGSAVVNDDGQLVGVVSSWHPGSDTEAGLVPFSQLKEFLRDL